MEYKEEYLDFISNLEQLGFDVYRNRPSNISDQVIYHIRIFTGKDIEIKYEKNFLNQGFIRFDYYSNIGVTVYNITQSLFRKDSLYKDFISFIYQIWKKEINRFNNPGIFYLEKFKEFNLPFKEKTIFQI